MKKLLKRVLFRKTLCLLSVLALATGCASHQKSVLASDPKSILVLLPKNNSFDVNAPHVIMSNISRPLAERGYYVFPVAVMERFMRENGLYSGEQIHAVPLAKFSEHFAPDAVLYITINDWGQRFQLVRSVTVVDASLELVDAKTGQPLWQKRLYKTYDTGNSNSSSFTTMLIGAVIDQVAGSLIGHTDKLAKEALNTAFDSLPAGERLRVMESAQR